MLGSGFTHSALAPVNSNGYINIVNCAIKQSGKKKCFKVHLNIYL